MAQSVDETTDLFIREISQYFPFNVSELQLLISVCASMLIRGISQSMFMVILGQAGTGKTTLIDLIRDINVHDDKLIIPRDDITPAEIVSGNPHVDPDDMLINKLPGHVLTIGELAPISQNQQAKRLWSYICRLLDGESLVRGVSGGAVGNSDSMRWAMIAAMVKITPNMAKQMQETGVLSRMVCLRLRPKPDATFRNTVNRLVKQMKQRSPAEKKEIGRHLVSALFHSILKDYPNGIRWNPQKNNAVACDYIASIAVLVSKLCNNIVKEDKAISGVPADDADPQRMSAHIYNICCGYEFVWNRNDHITLDSLKGAIRFIDTIPDARLDVLNAVLQHGGTLTKPDYMKKQLRCNGVKTSRSPGTADAHFDDLVVLGVCTYTKTKKITKPVKTITLHPDCHWLLDDAVTNAME